MGDQLIGTVWGDVCVGTTRSNTQTFVFDKYKY